MSEAKDFKSVRQNLPAPFEHIEISVNPSSMNFKLIGHSVGVMDNDKGAGTRYFSMEYPEALAHAILKATRTYRLKNKELLAVEEEA